MTEIFIETATVKKAREQEGFPMTEVKKCPKCNKEMIRGSAENLGLAFGCTRTEPKKPEDLPADRVQPYYCGNCGYMEFYRKLNLVEG